MTQTTIQDFYEQVLVALHNQVDDEGLVSFVEPVTTKGKKPAPLPVMVKDTKERRLVLPTKERLREGFDDSLQPFHPISENIARRGASPVLAVMQRTAKAMISYYLTELSLKMLEVAVDRKLHKDLPPRASDYLKKVSNADRKTFTDYTKVIQRAIAKNKAVVLYLKNGGTIDGEKYNRVCILHFPIMELLADDKDTVLGVKLRKKDRKTLLALLQHIIPHGDNPEYYSEGSNSKIAPFLDCFLRTYANIGGQFNKIIRRYNKPILNMQQIKLDYTDALDGLDKYYGEIPPLRGNEGTLGKGEKEEPKQDPRAPSIATTAFDRMKTTPATQAVKETAPWEEQPPTTTNVSTGGGMSMDDFRKLYAPPQPTPPPAYAQPAPSPYGQPQFQGYGAAPVPSWMVGQQPPGGVAPQRNPFAEALMVDRTAPPAPQPYGVHSGVSNYGYSGGGGTGGSLL